ncbi:MAG: IclR family transcriptional regulator [Acidimicrobiaceae bacterium]|nr:IclR family transcriptional regulator [Acidimicrobiaceae bacterium]MYC42498.1 IclR family transcriptional regulator [Acidimicrobiaceae bacterium]MYH87553.1 IclR family transcriptional regulator [Acidimicrobiaceae bacterium]
MLPIYNNDFQILKSMSDTTVPSDQNTSSTLHSSRSAERVLSLLSTVASSGTISLTAAAAQADLPTSTALRHLRLLTNQGYLIRDDQGLYSVGPAFVRMALVSHQRGPYARLTTAAQPGLERLVEATEESAYLAVRDGNEAVYIATAESRRAIRHVGWVGRSVPLDGTAVGQALLCAPEAPGSRPHLYFNTGSIEPDVTAVVAPIHGSAQVVGALSLLGPADRLADERLRTAAKAITEVAVSVSLALVAPEGSSQ